MGYFSNGSMGDSYISQYCENCRNWRDLKDGRGPGCPIWDWHMIWNYNQCADTEIGKLYKDSLEHFIPTGKNGFPDKCRMFDPATIDVQGQQKLF